MSASKGAGAKADDAKSLKQTRRRLSVMSDNKLIEGMDNVNLDEKEVAEVRYYYYHQERKKEIEKKKKENS